MNEPHGLVDAFVRMRELLLAATEAVPAEQRQTPFVGHWDLMDLLAHLVGWDYTNVKAIEELNSGRVPDFYLHYDPGWAAYNQQLIDRHGAEDWEALRASLRESQAAIVARLRLLTDEELTRELSEPGRPRPVSIARVLRAAIRDEREHLAQIRAFTAASA
jgi:uncharacterized damage-inducible protein DinB